MTNDSMPKSTQKLVTALTAEKAPEWLVEMARKNDFHDFLTSSATPMHDLILHASACGLNTIVEAVHRGDFDAGPDDGWKRPAPTHTPRAAARRSPSPPIEHPALVAVRKLASCLGLAPEGELDDVMGRISAELQKHWPWSGYDELRAKHEALIGELARACKERDGALKEIEEGQKRWFELKDTYYKDTTRLTEERDALKAVVEHPAGVGAVQYARGVSDQFLETSRVIARWLNSDGTESSEGWTSAADAILNGIDLDKECEHVFAPYAGPGGGAYCAECGGYALTIKVKS